MGAGWRESKEEMLLQVRANGGHDGWRQRANTTCGDEGRDFSFPFPSRTTTGKNWINKYWKIKEMGRVTGRQLGWPTAPMALSRQRKISLEIPPGLRVPTCPRAGPTARLFQPEPTRRARPPFPASARRRPPAAATTPTDRAPVSLPARRKGDSRRPPGRGA
jgi:hypothetical protein